MGPSNPLSVADVTLDLGAKNKRDLLEALSAQAADRIARPRQDILEALQVREELGSTALGKGVALPHAQLPGPVPAVVHFARLRRPIDFDAQDDEPVDLVFLVLWPSDDPHGLLDTTSGICRALRDPGLPRGLRLAKTPEDVVELLQRQLAFRTAHDAAAARRP